MKICRYFLYDYQIVKKILKDKQCEIKIVDLLPYIEEKE